MIARLFPQHPCHSGSQPSARVSPTAQNSTDHVTKQATAILTVAVEQATTALNIHSNVTEPYTPPAISHVTGPYTPPAISHVTGPYTPPTM